MPRNSGKPSIWIWLPADEMVRPGSVPAATACCSRASIGLGDWSYFSSLATFSEKPKSPQAVSSRS